MRDTALSLLDALLVREPLYSVDFGAYDLSYEFGLADLHVVAAVADAHEATVHLFAHDGLFAGRFA